MVKTLKHDADRLALIRSLDLLSLAGSPDLDRITELAAYAFRVPIALISIVEEAEQRFISAAGTLLERTELEASICAHAIEQQDVFEVEDLSLDERFRSNRLVTGSPKMRFYAGAPLMISSGHAIGTICLIDHVPRALTDDERDKLCSFARLVVGQISLLRSIGRRDPMTGLPNRQQLVGDLVDMQRTRADAGMHWFCIFDILDIQSANRVVQAVGLAPMESIIRQIGYRLSDLLPSSSPLYHVGVTRFAFVAEEQAEGELCALLAQLKAVAKQPVTTHGLVLQGMFFCGITTFDLSDTSDVLRRGVTAMHEAIEKRKTWCRYNLERDASLQRRYALATEVESAIENEEFFLMYQPRLCIETLRLRGAEALLRWQHPTLGAISPNEFIPVIESTMLMPTLTQWVLRRALQQMQEWDELGVVLDVSVNLSASDFNDGTLPGQVMATVEEFGVDPKRVELEVSESEWLRGRSGVVEQLETLRSHGFAVALDDFGSGYSNFSYLNEFPATIIKLDRSLITGMENDARRSTLVRTLLKLAAELGYKTVAEGVESAEQLGLLKKWHCVEAQGFFISKPLEPDRLLELVKASASS
ncbi:GGDEF and EAL domain-containing protein [Luteimonas fraxinea]|uniref:GGDEF and EAL domain-containing protein n=1 Tax=Luteimonas fraxinea TaxID=2901869 RepID=A0ABS8U6J7_9GAMM|nr:GGDEF and EAL domain-containing protein [Luteimonas fraxinea]MCD9095397.1 GGDEF and EAL domain-containing protein [Luteimonas fraxinea]UHH11394.1 GGDEF and EAL domain-containing protein [Luteimonas fraxinea]